MQAYPKHEPRPTVAQNVQTVLQIVQGPHASHSVAMLSAVMANSMGMAMHNAVTQQDNAQAMNSASTTSACARILAAAAPIPFSPTKGNDARHHPLETGETGETGYH